jgi:hypothetical protein
MPEGAIPPTHLPRGAELPITAGRRLDGDSATRTAPEALGRGAALRRHDDITAPAPVATVRHDRADVTRATRASRAGVTKPDAVGPRPRSTQGPQGPQGPQGRGGRRSPVADQRPEDEAGPRARPSRRRGNPKPTPPGAGRGGTNPAHPSRDRRRADSGPETTLHGLVGAGPSRVSPVAAMRARDVARPGPDDLERAERDLVIRRRDGVHPVTTWLPESPAPTGRVPTPATPGGSAGGGASGDEEAPGGTGQGGSAAGDESTRRGPGRSGSRRRGR